MRILEEFCVPDTPERKKHRGFSLLVPTDNQILEDFAFRRAQNAKNLENYCVPDGQNMKNLDENRSRRAPETVFLEDFKALSKRGGAGSYIYQGIGRF